jgi:hypothetical protein
MRPELRLLMEPMDPQRHPLPRSDASPHQLSELIVRLEQVGQRLQHFQHRYRTQVSQVDQGWLHQAQEQVAFYLAQLSQLDDRRAVVPEAPAPLQEVVSLELLAQQLLQLAQTPLVPRQETRRKGRGAAGGRAHRAPSRSPSVAVYAILIVLGRHATQAAHEQASDGAASGLANDQCGSSADPGAGQPAGQMRHDSEGSAMRFVPLYESRARTHPAEPGPRARRDHETSFEAQLELLRRLRRRIVRL